MAGGDPDLTLSTKTESAYLLMRATEKSCSKKTLHACRRTLSEIFIRRAELITSELRSCKVNYFRRRTIPRKAASRRMNQSNVTFIDPRKASPKRTSGLSQRIR